MKGNENKTDGKYNAFPSIKGSHELNRNGVEKIDEGVELAGAEDKEESQS